MSFSDVGGNELQKFKYYKLYWNTELKESWHAMRETKKKLKCAGGKVKDEL